MPDLRTLSEPEFTAIKARVLAALPDGLSESDFNRQVGTRLAAALGEAEASPEPHGSALSRIGSALAAVPAGLAHLATSRPSDVLAEVVGAGRDQSQKARDAASQGRYVEAAGHGVAAAIPVIGPAAAHAGEQIAGGNVAGGLTEGALLVAPEIPKVRAGVSAVASSAVDAARAAATKAGPLSRAAVVHGAPVVGGYVGYKIGAALGEPVEGAVAGGYVGKKLGKMAGDELARRFGPPTAPSPPTAAKPSVHPVAAGMSRSPQGAPTTAPVAPSAPATAPPTPASPAPPPAPASTTATTSATMSPARIRNEVGLAARRANAQFSEAELDAADTLVSQGTSPVAAVLEVKAKRAAPTESATLAVRDLTPVEVKEYARVTRGGKSPEVALAGIAAMRELLKRGASTVDAAEADIASRGYKR